MTSHPHVVCTIQWPAATPQDINYLLPRSWRRIKNRVAGTFSKWGQAPAPSLQQLRHSPDWAGAGPQLRKCPWWLRHDPSSQAKRVGSAGPVLSCSNENASLSRSRRRCRRGSRDDGQHDVRWVLATVGCRVWRHHQAAVVAQGFAGVRVHVEAREVAAGEIDPDAMALLEDVRGRVQLDGELVGPARFHQGL